MGFFKLLLSGFLGFCLPLKTSGRAFLKRWVMDQFVFKFLVNDDCGPLGFQLLPYHVELESERLCRSAERVRHRSV